VNSCCDIRRQLGKFHTSVNLQVAPLVKLKEKATSFHLTDPNTPIIGELATAIVRRFGVSDAHPELKHGLAGWFARYSSDVQYPNDDSGWMEWYAATALPGFDWPRFRAWLARCVQPNDFLNAPLCMEIENPKAVAVRNVVSNEEVI